MLRKKGSDEKMLMCVICGSKRDDGRGEHIFEDFCTSCLAKETEFLHEIKRKREIKEALESPAKDRQEPR